MNVKCSRGGKSTTALVIFLGAFLLFQVQPLIAKRILPWFGGSAAVWTVCLLCFQALLLAGYGYAHWLQRWPVRRQVQVHLGLLLLSLLCLPILPGEGWKPSGADMDPTLRIVSLLLITLGLPYLVLAATSPLLQAWWAKRNPDHPPYRLFSLSNIASLLALISYPILVEPFLGMGAQAWCWSLAYGLYALGVGWVAWFSRGVQTLVLLPGGVAQTGDSPGMALRLFWLLLAFAPCLLLIAATAHLCTNVAPIPLLWVAPLTLYLLSFVLCFDHPRWFRRGVWTTALKLSLGAATLLLLPRFKGASVQAQILVFLAVVFAASMVCHGELARRKPAVQHLTTFYLALALGGALAGFFAGVAAPRLFTGMTELPLALLLVSILSLGTWLGDPQAGGGRLGRLLGAGCLGFLAALVAGVLLTGRRMEGEGVVARGRNFYGTLSVRDKEDHQQRTRLMLHGTISHGGCFLDPARNAEPFGYYTPSSGIGMAIAALRTQGALKVGVLGLGSGSLLGYAQPEDGWTVYEINPLVVEMARAWFGNLARAKPELVLGDARLCLERETVSRQFDLLVMDAFSGDAIPVHLLTAEAFAHYRRHLRPGGVLAIHISNRYLNLVPVLQAEARSGAWQARRVRNQGIPERFIYTTDWVLLSQDEECFSTPPMRSAARLDSPLQVRRWRDDYSSLYQLLK